MRNWAYFEERFPELMQALKNARMKDRLGSSFLVISSKEEYRKEFPRLLACLAVCPTPESDGKPCETCAVCSQILHGTYPDLYMLAPVSKSRQIPVGNSDDEPDTLRHFEAQFHLSSTSESGWKIGIIQDAETMNESSQNAFLKTLEEPPEKTLFILTSGRAASLLPTTRSRCQMISLTENHCEYDFTHFEILPQILMRLQFQSKNDLPAAESCACDLIDILKSLSRIAQDSVKAKWAPKMEAASDLESSGIKLIEKRMEGEIGSEYRRLREQYSSLIHAWFAQIAMLSAKVDVTLLPNPELIQIFLDTQPRPVIREREAFRMLQEAENLVQMLKTNVNDELAIRSFVLTIAIRK